MSSPLTQLQCQTERGSLGTEIATRSRWLARRAGHHARRTEHPLKTVKRHLAFRTDRSKPAVGTDRPTVSNMAPISTTGASAPDHNRTFNIPPDRNPLSNQKAALGWPSSAPYPVIDHDLSVFFRKR